MSDTLFLFDRPESVVAWSAIDDRVMGGVSRSALRFDPAGHAVFSGQVSPDNNGGFASVRASVSPQPTAGIDTIELVARGDGHRYKLNLRTDRGFDGVNYQAAFAPPAGQWVTLRLTIDAFQPSYRGRAVPDAPPLRGARIEQVGLMIADRQFGAFALAIGAIRARRAGEGGAVSG
jgi:NADH dehydrogenase [ubiquinone] 1 alpha subcomplex assembly factor 1